MELATRSVVVYSIDIRNSCKNIKIPNLLRTRHYILYIDIDGVCDMATRRLDANGFYNQINIFSIYNLQRTVAVDLNVPYIQLRS